MKQRKIIIGAIGFVILAGALYLARTLATTPQEAPAREEESSRVVVHTTAVVNGEVASTIPITGRVIAADQLDLFAEVSGISTYGARPFKPGNSFRKGEILLQIDAREFARSLASAKSQFQSLIATVLPDLKIDFTDDYEAWVNYLKNLDVNKRLAPLPEVSNEQLKFFLTGRNVYSTYYNILEAEARLDKYIIRAPFDGTVTESFINQSALVRTGQALGEFIRDGKYELEASMSFDQAVNLKKGDVVNFKEVSGSATFTGSVIRINEKVDPGTQLVKVYFQMSDASLKSGMYLEGAIPSGSFNNAVELPIEALVDDEFVFIIEDGKAVKTPVSVLNKTSKIVVISGLSDNQQVITDQKNSAFEGTLVRAI